MPISLSAEAINCHRGGRPIFEDLSFDAEGGDLIQITGPNGSGKTSLLRILAGLASAESGRITWCGQSLAGVTRDAYKRDSFYIGHKTGVAGDLSAIENLELACQLHGNGRNHDPLVALKQLGLASKFRMPSRKLSAGQRQRIALSKLLVVNAALWLLDEPFTALDQNGKHSVEVMLENHCRAGGIAIIATHQSICSSAQTVKHIALGERDCLD